MPAKSKSQFNLMQAVARRSIKKPGLSEAVAKEYISGQSPKKLPEKVSLKKALKGVN